MQYRAEVLFEFTPLNDPPDPGAGLPGGLMADMVAATHAAPVDFAVFATDLFGIPTVGEDHFAFVANPGHWITRPFPD